MSEYIERETAINAMLRRYWDGKETLREIMNSVPTADVAPVVHAEWVSMERPHSAKDVCKCSNCGVVVTPYEFWHYCPACGAEMEVETP